MGVAKQFIPSLLSRLQLSITDQDHPELLLKKLHFEVTNPTYENSVSSFFNDEADRAGNLD